MKLMKLFLLMLAITIIPAGMLTTWVAWLGDRGGKMTDGLTIFWFLAIWIVSSVLITRSIHNSKKK